MLQVSFIMIYTIHKISIMLKITITLKRFLRSIKDFYFYSKKIVFFAMHNDEKFKA